MNNCIINSIERVLSNESDFKKSGSFKWTISMPYRYKLSKEDLDYISRYGVEDYLDYQYSLFEDKVWRSVLRKVRKVLPKEINIEDYELHDNYIYECVECEYPTEYLARYEKRIKKLIS